MVAGKETTVRGRNIAVALGLGVVALLVYAALAFGDPRVGFHLLRLHVRPEALAGYLEDAETSPAGKSLARFLDTPAGRRAFLRVSIEAILSEPAVAEALGKSDRGIVSVDPRGSISYHVSRASGEAGGGQRLPAGELRQRLRAMGRHLGSAAGARCDVADPPFTLALLPVEAALAAYREAGAARPAPWGGGFAFLALRRSPAAAAAP